MLFLLSVYFGVGEGTMEYIKSNKADLWVLQKNAENILRHASVLLMDQGITIRGFKGVRAVSPVLMLISNTRRPHLSYHMLTPGMAHDKVNVHPKLWKTKKWLHVIVAAPLPLTQNL